MIIKGCEVILKRHGENGIKFYPVEFGEKAHKGLILHTYIDHDCFKMVEYNLSASDGFGETKWNCSKAFRAAAYTDQFTTLLSKDLKKIIGKLNDNDFPIHVLFELDKNALNGVGIRVIPKPDKGNLKGNTLGDFLLGRIK